MIDPTPILGTVAARETPDAAATCLRGFGQPARLKTPV